MTTRLNASHCGIDLGTTNSTVAVFESSQPKALPIDPDNSSPQVLKSLIYTNPSGRVEIGQKAITSYLWDLESLPPTPPRLVYTGRQIKTFGPSSASRVGKVIFVPEIAEIDDSGRGRLLQSLKSVLTNQSYQGTNIFGKFYTLEDLLSLLLGQIKLRSETILGHQLTQIVLGRPVRYVGDPAQEKLALQRLTTVAQNIGFKDIEFEYEPVGAALAYGLDLKKPQRIIVFDFGGGTLDVCVMEFPQKKILSVSGRPIGGDLLDSAIVQNQLLKYFGAGVKISHKIEIPRFLFDSISRNWFHISLLKNVKTLESFDYFIPNANLKQPVINLRDLIQNDLGYNFFAAVDQAKIRLSEELKTTFEFSLPGQKIAEPLNRPQYESFISELVADSSLCLDEALALASLEPTDIDKVILTGGSSKTPIFLSMITQKFGFDKLIFSDPFTSVALGLSIRAHELFSR